MPNKTLNEVILEMGEMTEQSYNYLSASDKEKTKIKSAQFKQIQVATSYGYALEDENDFLPIASAIQHNNIFVVELLKELNLIDLTYKGLPALLVSYPDLRNTLPTDNLNHAQKAQHVRRAIYEIFFKSQLLWNENVFNCALKFRNMWFLNKISCQFDVCKQQDLDNTFKKQMSEVLLLAIEAGEEVFIKTCLEYKQSKNAMRNLTLEEYEKISSKFKHTENKEKLENIFNNLAAGMKLKNVEIELKTFNKSPNSPTFFSGNAQSFYSDLQKKANVDEFWKDDPMLQAHVKHFANLHLKELQKDEKTTETTSNSFSRP